MATNQNLLWIALPDGVQVDELSKGLNLSVFVNPRLYANQSSKLSDFPDFLRWGELMQPENVNFSIEVDDGTTVHHLQADIVSDPPNAALWQTLFHENIPVRPYQFKEDDLSNRPIVSFSVKQILNYIKGRYQNIAIHSALNLPNARREYSEERHLHLSQEFEELINLHSQTTSEGQLTKRLSESLEGARREAVRRQEIKSTEQDPILPLTLDNRVNVDDVKDAFYRSLLFHHRPSEAKPVDMPDDTEAEAHFKDTVDFHQMLSALGDFPELLRMLGLVIDLRIDTVSFPWTQSEETPAKNRIRIVPQWTSSFADRQDNPQGNWSADYCPWTFYVYKNDGVDIFHPYSRGEDFFGVWQPSDEISLVQVDSDGIALKTFNLAGSLARMEWGESDAPIDTPEKVGVPTIRTSGIAVVRNKNAFQFNSLFHRSAEINRMFEEEGPPKLVNLYAEDISKGYRVDIFDETTGEWKSLHERKGTYSIVNSPGLSIQVVDEGFTQPSVTSPAKQESPADELYIHESLFTWDGWSLSAPLPGKSISRNSRAPHTEEPETMPQKVTNNAMTELGLETTFEVKAGSLPRLRFGRNYRLRLRTVDLAGNGPTSEGVKSLEETLPQKIEGTYLPKNDLLMYRRFEPINAPELLPRQLYRPITDSGDAALTAYTEGESLERLVIRSNFDKSTSDYANAHPAYHLENERHIAPPKASLQLIEMHGLLDEAVGAKKSGETEESVRLRIKSVYDLAKRESGTFNDSKQPGVYYISTSHDPESPQGYAVHTTEQLELPYLPDPWATGVVFQGVPGVSPGEIFVVEFRGDSWHEVKPFRFQLVEGEGRTPEWNEETRVLTVYLHKSGQPKIRVSSMFGGDIDQMGLWKWITDAVKNFKITQQELEKLEYAILDGRHWMFTPYREITLVHAVQQPLVEPYPYVLEHNRYEGGTAAYLHGEIELHAPSTSKLDVLAEWKEPRDDLEKDEPDREPVEFKTHVMELPTGLNNQAVSVEGRNSDCAPEGYAIHIEEEKVLLFNSELAEMALECLQNELKQATVLQEKKWLQHKVEIVSKVVRHEFGDTKYRRVRYRFVATSSFREYFMPMETGQLTRESEEVELEVLSSANPASPRVLYVLPTFGWEQKIDRDTGTITSIRKGGGIRVYLDRPWWSSGEGEMLGVVLLESDFVESDPNIHDSSRNDFTYWGDDPIWKSEKRLSRPKPEDFNSSYVFNTVKLADKVKAFAKVIGYHVYWDPEKKLWYADIEMNDGDAYYPFVRLALARFQPNSLVYRDLDNRPYRDLRISPIVLTDFVQTAPNRTVHISKSVADSGNYSVSVSGVTYSAQKLLTKQVNAASEVTVQIQKRNMQVEDETLSWSDLLEPISLQGSPPNNQGIVTWQGQITVPAEYLEEELRFVIQEFESLYGAVPKGGKLETSKRSVFMDIIPL